MSSLLAFNPPPSPSDLFLFCFSVQTNSLRKHWCVLVRRGTRLCGFWVRRYRSLLLIFPCPYPTLISTNCDPHLLNSPYPPDGVYAFSWFSVGLVFSGLRQVPVSLFHFRGCHIYHGGNFASIISHSVLYAPDPSLSKVNSTINSPVSRNCVGLILGGFKYVVGSVPAHRSSVCLGTIGPLLDDPFCPPQKQGWWVRLEKKPQKCPESENRSTWQIKCRKLLLL